MQDDYEKREKLERLERKLNSRNAPNIIDRGRSDLDRSPEPLAESVAEDWQDVRPSGFDELAARVSKMAQKKNTFVKKIFIFSVLFFVAACGVAAYVFFGGVNSVSSKNVDMKVSGPISVGGGQEVLFEINVINNNNIDLESASLLVKYPEGTRSPNDLTKELSEERFPMDKIRSGQSANQTIKVVFFGEKEDVKRLDLSLEYRVANSSALFYKEKTHEVSISSSPIIVTPTYPKEINSNQEVSFNIELASNSKDRLSDFLVNVEYPFGFVFASASPKPAYGNNIWHFSDLVSGDAKTVSIRGSIIGQDNEEKVFKITVGTPNPNDERVIATPFSQLTESIMLKKPFIGLDVSVGGESGDYAAESGEEVRTNILVRNNLSSKLFNVVVEASLSGGALDNRSVGAETGGFFQSSNNTALWDKRSVEQFSEMGPGAEKKVSFRLTPLSYASVAKGAKPEVVMVIKTRGERILESGSVESVSSSETRKIVLATDIGLTSKLTRSIGSIENSGPIPPKADSKTTYTVTWAVSNSFNQTSNVEVRATLPSYVKLTNLKSPSGEIISFNPVTNEVVWSVGSLLPNTGFGSAQKEVSFQIEFLPSVSQLGLTPTLIGETALSGIDKVTGLKVSAKAPSLNTSFYNDPSFRQGDDKVVQ